MFSQCKAEEGGGEEKTRRGGKRTLASGRAWVCRASLRKMLLKEHRKGLRPLQTHPSWARQ